MRLLDSNVVIYAADPAYSWLADWIEAEEFKTSVVTKIEVLGYHNLADDQTEWLVPLFERSLVVPLDEKIEELAISLRRQRKIGLGDAIIAATAVVYGYELMTWNVKDFEWISGLKVINPFDRIEEN